MAGQQSRLKIEIIPKLKFKLSFRPFLLHIWPVKMERRAVKVIIKVKNEGSQRYEGVVKLWIAHYHPGLNMNEYLFWKEIPICSLEPNVDHESEIVEYFPYSGDWSILPTCDNAQLVGKLEEKASFQPFRIYAVPEVFLMGLTVVAVIAGIIAAILALSDAFC